MGTEVDDVRIGAFRPIRQRRAADEVIAVVADAIRSGLYRPGDFLPRQADLAERLQVSRSVVVRNCTVLAPASNEVPQPTDWMVNQASRSPTRRPSPSTST